MQTKLMQHNIYNDRILLNKKKWQELGFKTGEPLKITKVADGKVLIEVVKEQENYLRSG